LHLFPLRARIPPRVPLSGRSQGVAPARSKRRAGTAAHAPSSRGTQEPPLSRRQTSHRAPAQRIRWARPGAAWKWASPAQLRVNLAASASARTCSECRASAAMRGCSPRPKHASGENGTWSHGLVASRPIEWQQESSGRSPFPRARLLCNVHVRSGCNSQIRVVMLEDLAVFCNEFIHVSHSILMLCKVQQI
jgi:hypothetical protein